MFEYKPDYAEAKKRVDAWWNCAVLDRAMTYISFPKPAGQQVPGPKPKRYPTIRDRWLDTERVADSAAAYMANTVWYADSMPICHPNLGPEWFSACYDCELEFSDSTSWSVPNLKDWSPASVAKIRFNPKNFYWKKMWELTDAFLARGRGRFVVGYTDMHGGGDAVAAFRDPQQLCLDMIEHPQAVKALSDRITDDYLKVYDQFHERLSAAGMPSTTWMGVVSSGKMYVPSNDFSCMISAAMFEEIFIPGIERECAHMDWNIYHLDGPQALRFLDRLMAIPKMHAIQWVAGAGGGGWRDWIKVYQRIQRARKAFVVYVSVKDLDDFFTYLRPEGAWLYVGGIDNKADADAALKKIQRWGRKGR